MGIEGTERVETVIVGGGQAGLATGYFLQRDGRPAVILDAYERVGDAWRTRWDSLRLFTTARYDGLPGFRFPAPGWSFPTKDEMADYLETYAERFGLDVRTGSHVQALARHGDRFVLTTADGRLEADNVVVATGAHRVPRQPAFASELDPSIVQLHSSEYRRPSQLREGGVLLVGAGNSGADIALEVVRTHDTWLAGKEPGHIPVRIERSGKYFFVLIRFFGHHVFTERTPLGRRARPQGPREGRPVDPGQAQGPPRCRRGAGRAGGGGPGRPSDARGRTDARRDERDLVHRVPHRLLVDRPAGLRGGRRADARPRRGHRPSRGLYFVGLPFQYSKSSDVLPGIGRDHAYIAKQIASRDRADRSGRRSRSNAVA